ncbi:MAG: hypothetical protein EKK64_01040 [Neisseriaceae bacterium]|nr:MAG: hypothetical protein EKK64_01040 [Neisseriaceae bacterium]
MALTPHLENAILQGWATFRIVNHAFANFSKIDIPNNATVIITHVKWYPFLNPIGKNGDLITTTYREFFQYSEHTLKIDGKKSTNFLVFRNEFEFLWTQSGINFNLDDTIDLNTLNSFFLPLQKRPIHTDVYFICEEYIKLTATRNAFIDKLIPNYGVLNPRMAEQPPQVGMQGVTTLLNVEMNSKGLKKQEYVPPTYKGATMTVPPTAQTIESYMQGIDIDYSTYNTLDKIKFPYHTQPLIEIGLVVVNNNNFNKLKNG